MLSPTVLKELLPAFEKKFLTFPVVQWGRQWARVDHKKQLILDDEGKAKVTFDDQRRLNIPLRREHLISHFSGKPEYKKKILPKSLGGGEVPAVWGSYGMSLNLSSNYVKFVGIDADEDKFVDLFFDHLKPQLDKFEIEYIEEYSSNSRAHYWFAVDDIEQKYVAALLNQFRDNAGFSKADWFKEQYPHESRITSLFRLPFGYHIRTGTVNWGNCNGQEINCLEEGLQSFINLKPVTDEKLLSLLKETPKERKIFHTPEKILLKPGTELSTPEAPAYIKDVASKCPALNWLLKYIQDENCNVDHAVGLGLATMATFNDNINKTKEGFEWFQSLPKGVNSPEQHLMYYYPERGGTPTCKTWESYLDKCKGCPYKEQIITPRQLYKAETLEKTKVGDIRSASLEEIRAEVFPEADRVIDKALETSSCDPTYILLESVQNSGKSRYADQLARRLAKEGKTVCIACNTVKVALEHKEAIEFEEDKVTPTGDKAFALYSYDSVFEYFSGGITCPHFEEIKNLRSLGIDSSYYKKEYCKNCPFYEECNYPRQYSLVHEEKYKIVIIQHAHMACNEVIKQLMAKRFDVLIIDETFIDYLTMQLIPTKKELEILEALEKPQWLQEVFNWMKDCGYPLGTVKPKASDLRPILEAFRDAKVPYRLDQFLRQFNELEYMHPTTGVMKFSPVPRIPVCVFTDATPTIEELEIILNTKNIIKVGGGIVTDPTVYHPDNKVYQILDGRTSKAEMLKREKLYEYLEFIGDKMRKDYKDLTALITVFKTYKDPETKEIRNIEEEAFEWLLRNYPEIMPRIAVNHMAVGTNEWAHFNVQFILAGPYVNQKQLKEETYKLKFIVNYWRRQDDLPLVNNIYPSYLGDDSSDGEKFYEPVRRIHKDGIFEYPQFKIQTPDPRSWEYLIWKRLQAKKQQAGRIRHKQGKQTIFYFMDHSNMGGFLVTDNITESEILGYIRQQE